MPEVSSVRPVRAKHLLALTGLLIAITALVFGFIVGLGLVLTIDGETLIQWLVFGFFAHSLLAILILLKARSSLGVSYSELGLSKPSWRLFHVLWQIPLILALSITVQIVVVNPLNNSTEPRSNSVKELFALSPSAALIVLAFLSVGILTPVWEELFFRGFLWSWLSSKFWVGLAIFFNGVAFALVHGMIVLIPYYLVLGMGLAWLRHFHRNIWGSLALHAALNTVLCLLALSGLSN